MFTVKTLQPVGEDCERRQNVQWPVILDKCIEIFSKYSEWHCFSMPYLFVLISHHFKPLTEIRTN